MNAYFADWQPWIQALGWTLLHFLWQGSVVGAGYALLRWSLPKAGCEFRYALGLTALAVLAACPLLTLWWIHPQTELVATAARALVTTGDAGGVSAAASSAGSGADAAQWLPWVVLLWVLGALAVGARALHQWRALDRVACRMAERHPELERLLARLTPCFGFFRRVRVLASSHIDTPTLIGWIKPVILLPMSVAIGFPSQQVELILAHELGHLRRCDHLVNLAQAVLETLLYYHPVVHWISREVRNEREICCDQLVLRVIRGEPREYARTLAALEELRYTQSRLAVAATGGVLLERVRRIVGMPAPRLAAARPNAALWLVAAATAVFAFTAALRVHDEHGGEAARVASIILDRLPRPDVRVLANFALKLPLADALPESAGALRISKPVIMAPLPAASAPAMKKPLASAAPVLILPVLRPPRIAPPAKAGIDLKPIGEPPEVARLRVPISAPVIVRAPLLADRGAGSDCIERTGSHVCRHIERSIPENLIIIYSDDDSSH